MRAAGSWMAILVLAAACSKSETEESAPAPESSASVHPAFGQATAFAERLKKMRAAMEKIATQGERACDDAAIRKKLGSEAGKLLTADYDYLERYTDPHAAPRYRGGNQRWQFLTTPGLRAVRAPAELQSRTAAVDTAYRIKQLEERYRYAAVIRTDERRLPEMNGDQYEPGSFTGWVALFDLRTGELLCQARLSAQSGPDVAAKEGTPPEKALWNDFVMRVRRALNESVGRMTQHLRLDLG